MAKLCSDLHPLVEELRGGSLAHADSLMEPVARDYGTIISALEELGDS